MVFLIGEYYTGRGIPKPYTLEQIVDRAKAQRADGIRLACRAGVEPVDFAVLDSVLDMLQAKGFKVLFNPFHNWKDHYGYFGSEAWFLQWESFARRFAGDNRIWAYDLFNEPNADTWALGITNYDQVQAAQAACIDRIRALGDDHTVVLACCMVQGNYSWTYNPVHLRPNTLQAQHFSGSKWAETTYGSGVNFWEQWALNRLLSFESRYGIKVIIDEVSIGNGTWASWQFQKDALVALINWCVANGHDFSWHCYSWDLNPSYDFYSGKTSEILALTNLGEGPVCPPGQHWDENQQSCQPDIPTCPPGEHWDSVQLKCVPNVVTGGCFIATACGTGNPSLTVLRLFRDKCMPPSLVWSYYRLSPSLARLISGHIYVMAVGRRCWEWLACQLQKNLKL